MIRSSRGCSTPFACNASLPAVVGCGADVRAPGNPVHDRKLARAHPDDRPTHLTALAVAHDDVPCALLRVATAQQPPRFRFARRCTPHASACRVQWPYTANIPQVHRLLLGFFSLFTPNIRPHSVNFYPTDLVVIHQDRFDLFGV